MAQVPVYGEPQVAASGIPNVHIGADAPLESFGGGQPLAQEGQAAKGLAGTAFDLAQQEKQKADQLAFMSADGKASALQTQVQVNASKMLGQNAMGAPDYAQQQWQDGVKKIQEGLANDAQRNAFARSASQRWNELNGAVQTHVSGEMQKFDDNETSSYLVNSKNSAVLNAYDDQKVQTELDRQKAALLDWGHRKGIQPNSDAFQAKLQDQQSSTISAVIQGRLDKDQPGNIQAAKDYFDAHRDSLNAADLLSSQRQIETAETASISLGAWNGMKDWKLSNGDPDTQRMAEAINARSDLSDERKQQVIQFVDGQAREAAREAYQQKSSNDLDFKNAVLQQKQQGVTMQDALKIAPQYADNLLDQQNNEKWVMEQYQAPNKSDPLTHLNLWEGIQKYTVSQQDIDRAHMNGQLSGSDWMELRQQLFKAKTEGTDPNDKLADERVKGMAQESIGNDKDKMSQFMYVYHTQTQDMPAAEKVKAAQDLLGANPKSSWFNSEPATNYQVQSQKLDAQNIAWGKAYQDVGQSQINAIGGGLLYGGKGSWGLSDVNSFAAQFGGYDAIKAGTPVNNAINSLISRNKVVTAANVKAVLSKHPDGKY